MPQLGRRDPHAQPTTDLEAQVLHSRIRHFERLGATFYVAFGMAASEMGQSASEAADCLQAAGLWPDRAERRRRSQPRSR
jgi:hypothetical protein